ncbi:MAG: winged helix-turn-helix domain-containing protein [Gammaproteobacteria bacterium]|nr:winged helix-turn-helix domain-containing protein [Gammaproteobacteria bacterium]
MDSRPLYHYRFGNAEFDEARFELRVAGLPVDLEQRPLQVLTALLRHPDEVVTREELFETVWAGRPTVDNVLANAVAKLRKALGPEDGSRIVTLPRVGYRLTGPVERAAAGRRLVSRMDLAAGLPVPGCEHFLLEAQLGPSHGSEVWLARHGKTGEARVYKFSGDGERLTSLKREATIYRLLRETLGERDDLVRVIDWNFETAPFYLECEYGGHNLADWAAGDGGLAELPLERRLALFLQIADAVAAAHGVGVLHKDLKPANLLITPRGDGWQIRIADFGSGRLLEPGRLEELGITGLGLTVTQAVSADTSGTLAYLAPELLAGQPPTVKSDLYALGLLLYQLVVGDLRRPLAPGWEQDLPDDLLCEDIAAATDGTPERRLASVDALGERLRRRAERRAERDRLHEAEITRLTAQRLLERNRARRPWIAAAGLLLVAGLGTTLWQFRQAEQARDRAQRETDVAQAVNRFMTDDLIGAANPAVAGNSEVTMKAAARAAIPKIDAEFTVSAPMVQAQLHHAMQELLSRLSDHRGAAEEGRRAIAAYSRLRAPDPLALAEIRIRLAADLADLSRHDEAVAVLEQVRPTLPRLVKQYPKVQVEYWSAWSDVEGDRLRLNKSLAYDRKAWAMVQTLPQAPADLRDGIEFNLSDTLRMLGQYAQSESLLRDLLARRTRRLGAQHAQTYYTMAALGNTLAAAGSVESAMPLLTTAIAGLTKTLGAEHRRTLLAKGVLANTYFLRARFDRAADLYGQVADSLVRKYGGGSTAAISQRLNAAVSTEYAGDALAAEPIYRRALAATRGILDENAPLVQSIRYHMASCLLDLKRPGEAAPLLAGLQVGQLNLSEPEPDWNGRLAFQSGRLALQTGHPRRAVQLLETAEKLIGANEPDGGEISLSLIRDRLQAARIAVAGLTGR